MKNLSMKEKILLLGVLLAGIVYVYFTFYLTPMLNKTEQINIRVESLEADFDKVTVAKVKTASLQKELKDLQGKRDELMKAVPGTARVPDIIYNIKKYTDGGKVRLDDLQIEDVKEAEDSQNTNNQNGNNTKNSTDAQASSNRLKSIPIHITLSGSYGSVNNVIKQIEEESRANSFMQLSFDKKSDSSDITAKLVIAYYCAGNQQQQADYQFNTNTYSKEDPFK